MLPWEGGVRNGGRDAWRTAAGRVATCATHEQHPLPAAPSGAAAGRTGQGWPAGRQFRMACDVRSGWEQRIAEATSAGQSSAKWSHFRAVRTGRRLPRAHQKQLASRPIRAAPLALRTQRRTRTCPRMWGRALASGTMSSRTHGMLRCGGWRCVLSPTLVADPPVSPKWQRRSDVPHAHRVSMAKNGGF